MPIFKFFSSRRKKEEATSVEVTVAAKQDRDEGWHGRGAGGINRSAGMIPTANIMPIRPVYRITFELADRKSFQLEVSGKVYKSLGVGVKGVLVYDGTFKEFHANKTLEEINGEITT